MLECPWVHPQLGGMAGPVYSFHRCGFRRFRASAKTALSGSCRLLVSHTHSLSFFFPFFLCPSLWSIHLDVFHRVTNDSMPLAFFFHPVLSSCLERDLLSWQPCGFSCIRTWGCCTMHGTTPGPLCNTDDSFSFLFFLFFIFQLPVFFFAHVGYVVLLARLRRSVRP